MPEMFCCHSRMRIDRNGVALVFHEQINAADSASGWQAYQIFESDRWICPECKRSVIAGLGHRPIMHRYENSVEFDNYLADLKEGRLMDMIGRPQPWVEIFD